MFLKIGQGAEKAIEEQSQVADLSTTQAEHAARTKYARRRARNPVTSTDAPIASPVLGYYLIRQCTRNEHNVKAYACSRGTFAPALQRTVVVALRHRHFFGKIREGIDVSDCSV